MSMQWPDSKLLDLLGIQYPIIQAPMIVQKPLAPLAAAVCNAGGLGSLGCAEMSLNEIESNVGKLRDLTNKPFNLNFFLHQAPVFDKKLDAEIRKSIDPFYRKLDLALPVDASSNSLATFDDGVLALLLHLKPAVVSFHFGSPDTSIVDALRGAGIVTMATATTVCEALQLDESGIDVIIAQGWEAGGHRGSFKVNCEAVGIGTMALVPQIVDAVNVPVVAAGGIGDGRGIAAAFALGASGALMGTAFLSCTETPISDQHRAALLNAKDDDTGLSRAFSGRPCRAKTTPYSQTMARFVQSYPDFPIMYNYSSPLKKHGIEHDDLDYQFLLYGQAASLNRELSADAFIKKLVAQTQAILN